MKKFLYHVTPAENVKSILQNGLIRKGFAVYCSEKPYSWWRPGMAIFKISTTGLQCDVSTFLPDSDEVLIWGNIGPGRLFLCNPSEVIPRRMYQSICRKDKKKMCGETMDFPATPKEFIDRYSFKDREEIYTNGALLVPLFRVEDMIDHYFSNRGKCDVCDTKDTGRGGIGIYGNGWQVCIRQQGKTYDMVINHCGDQIAVPIAFCPECGAKMDGGAEDV